MRRGGRGRERNKENSRKGSRKALETAILGSWVESGK